MIIEIYSTVCKFILMILCRSVWSLKKTRILLIIGSDTLNSGNTINSGIDIDELTDVSTSSETKKISEDIENKNIVYSDYESNLGSKNEIQSSEKENNTEDLSNNKSTITKNSLRDTATFSNKSFITKKRRYTTKNKKLKKLNSIKKPFSPIKHPKKLPQTRYNNMYDSSIQNKTDLIQKDLSAGKSTEIEPNKTINPNKVDENTIPQNVITDKRPPEVLHQNTYPINIVSKTKKTQNIPSNIKSSEIAQDNAFDPYVTSRKGLSEKIISGIKPSEVQAIGQIGLNRVNKTETIQNTYPSKKSPEILNQNTSPIYIAGKTKKAQKIPTNRKSQGISQDNTINSNITNKTGSGLKPSEIQTVGQITPNIVDKTKIIQNINPNIKHKIENSPNISDSKNVNTAINNEKNEKNIDVSNGLKKLSQNSQKPYRKNGIITEYKLIPDTDLSSNIINDFLKKKESFKNEIDFNRKKRGVKHIM